MRSIAIHFHIILLNRNIIMQLRTKIQLTNSRSVTLECPSTVLFSPIHMVSWKLRLDLEMQSWTLLMKLLSWGIFLIKSLGRASYLHQDLILCFVYMDHMYPLSAFYLGFHFLQRITISFLCSISILSFFLRSQL